MRQAGRLVIVGLALAGAAGGCRPAVPPGPRNVVVTGSYTMAPLVQEIGQRFEAAHPGTRIDVQAVGSARGVSDAQQGLADVGMVARRLRPEEGGLHAFVLARDGVCLVVPRSNPLTGLSDGQVIGVFTRTTSNWRQLGGPDAPITVVGLADDRALAQTFFEFYHLQPGQVRPDLRAGDTGQVLKAVADKPHAVGYAALGQALAEAPGLSLRVLPCGSVPATLSNVGNGTYGLVRPLLLVTRDPPRGPTQEFLDFARSPAVHDLIEKYHAVPPPETAAPSGGVP
jgi:phosphate transport system substrate-binding protein